MNNQCYCDFSYIITVHSEPKHFNLPGQTGSFQLTRTDGVSFSDLCVCPLHVVSGQSFHTELRPDPCPLNIEVQSIKQ